MVNQYFLTYDKSGSLEHKKHKDNKHPLGKTPSEIISLPITPQATSARRPPIAPQAYRYPPQS